MSLRTTVRCQREGGRHRELVGEEGRLQKCTSIPTTFHGTPDSHQTQARDESNHEGHMAQAHFGKVERHRIRERNNGASLAGILLRIAEVVRLMPHTTHGQKTSNGH